MLSGVDFVTWRRSDVLVTMRDAVPPNPGTSLITPERDEAP